MARLVIEEKGCRGCTLCVDVCPTDVLVMDAAGQKAIAKTPDDYIGCTSCAYICPSRAITVEDYAQQKPYYRIEENVALVEKFLQRAGLGSELTAEGIEGAIKDASVRLAAVGQAAESTLGRGQKAVGRKAGSLMAEHVPEMYEAKTFEEAVLALKARFADAFDFEPKIEADGVSLCFTHCAIAKVVEANGEKIGSAILCTLFHEYWAGLIGAFNNQKLMVAETRDNCCNVRLETRA